MITYPTDEAWSSFMENHDDIRACCEMFLPAPRMEIPNTRIGIVDDEGNETITDQRAAMALPVNHLLVDFDAAVKVKDSGTLMNIMNDAWLRAPEDRAVYRIPGFSRMCDFLDFSIEGFVDPDGPSDEAEAG